MALLRVFDVIDGARDYVIGKDPIIIGRERSKVDICLHDIAVSRRHVKIYWLDSLCYVEDLGSSCGTLLNNIPVHVSKISNRDNIQLGTTVIEYRDDVVEDDIDEQTTDTVDGLMSNFRSLPTKMKLSYRVLKVLADDIFSSGDTIVIGRGGLLLEAYINPVDLRNVFELKIEWPDGNSKMFLGEIVATVKRGSFVCMKLHNVPELKLNTMFDKVARSSWVNVTSE